MSPTPRLVQTHAWLLGVPDTCASVVGAQAAVETPTPPNPAQGLALHAQA